MTCHWDHWDHWEGSACPTSGLQDETAKRVAQMAAEDRQVAEASRRMSRQRGGGDGGWGALGVSENQRRIWFFSELVVPVFGGHERQTQRKPPFLGFLGPPAKCQL